MTNYEREQEELFYAINNIDEEQQEEIFNEFLEEQENSTNIALVEDKKDEEVEAKYVADIVKGLKKNALTLIKKYNEEANNVYSYRENVTMGVVSELNENINKIKELASIHNIEIFAPRPMVNKPVKEITVHFEKAVAIFDIIKEMVRIGDPLLSSLYFEETDDSLKLKNDFTYYYFDEDVNKVFVKLSKKSFGQENMLDLASYIKTIYGISTKNQSALDDAIVRVASYKKSNKIREYVKTLEWDGVKRLDNFIIDVLNPEIRTEEDRVYYQKGWHDFAVSAIRRLFQPEAPHDMILNIISPDQGVGKTWFSRLLGMGFTENMPDMNQNYKDSLKALSRSWITLDDEGTIIDSMPQAKRKQLTTKTKDRFRPAFAKYEVEFNFYFVLVKTSNILNFKNDASGSRREFAIIARRNNGKTASENFKDLDIENAIKQMWAEAYVEYKNKKASGDYIPADFSDLPKPSFENRLVANSELNDVIENIVNNFNTRFAESGNEFAYIPLSEIYFALGMKLDDNRLDFLKNHKKEINFVRRALDSGIGKNNSVKFVFERRKLSEEFVYTQMGINPTKEQKAKRATSAYILDNSTL